MDPLINTTEGVSLHRFWKEFGCEEQIASLRGVGRYDHGAIGDFLGIAPMPNDLLIY